MTDPATPRSTPYRVDRSMLALGAVLCVTTFIRLTVVARQPLWMDEVWTGMIAAQPSLAAFAKECYKDVNGPLYYAIDALWARVAGLSDLALRAPAMAFGVLAPGLALLPHRLMDRTTRYVWCALLTCWMPGLILSLEARYYSLYFLLGCGNAIAFAALMQAPSRAKAWGWSGVSSLLILSHYFGFILAGLQGLVFLAVWRGQAWRCWPAALAFVPPFAMLGLQASLLTTFSSSGVSWIPLVGPGDIIPALGFIAGAVPMLTYLALWTAAALWYARQQQVGAPLPLDRALWLTVAVAGVATVVAMALGAVRPLFMARYVMGYVPALLLGLALLARRFAQGWSRAPLFLVAAYACAAVKIGITPPGNITPLNFAVASDALMAVGTRNLVFLWDNPIQTARPDTHDQSSLAGVGGFFFARAGHPVAVDALRPDPRIDPNMQMLGAAKRPGTALLWLYDLNVAGTLAAAHPPRITAIDPRWHCRNYGEGTIGVIACSQAF